MGHGHPSVFKPVEYYRFDGKGKKIALTILGVGIVLLILGLVLGSGAEYKMTKDKGHGGGHDAGHHSSVHGQVPARTVEEAPAAEGHATEQKAETKGQEAHGEKAESGHDAHHNVWWNGHYASIQSEADLPTFKDRVFTNLLTNSFMFTGIALLAIFFIAIHHATNGGWYVQVQRIAEAMGYWLFVGPVLLLLIFFAAGSDLYMWLDPEAIKDPEWKHLVEGKTSWYLSQGFFIARNILFFVLWILLFWSIRKNSTQEDLGTPGSKTLWMSRNKLSGLYILIFAFTFSMASWDWMMSVETTWFSTMFAVRTFSGAWVSAIALIILVTVFLKRSGYLPTMSPGIIHDLGKYMFGFSVFWTYIWFCEFLLIWYANIPEEGFYFFNRMGDYPVMFAMLGLLNFVFPFLVLMTNDTKRQLGTLVTVACIILFGHWLDFYMMVAPGSMGPFGSVGLLELGMFITFLGAFLFLTGTMLAKKPLMPKNHPFLEESLKHSYDI